MGADSYNLAMVTRHPHPTAALLLWHDAPTFAADRRSGWTYGKTAHLSCWGDLPFLALMVSFHPV